MSLIAMIRRLSRFRFLLRQTVVREIRVRYKQTVVGLLWAILQPLVFSAIFVAIFKVFRGDLASGQHFSQLFVMMSLWTFTANSVTLATSSIVNHPGLVTKIAFPREVFPLGFVSVGLIDLLVNGTVGTALILWSGFTISVAGLAAVVASITCLFLYVFALAILFSGLNVLYRDFKYIVPIVVQVTFFGTPIIYAVDDLGGRAARLLEWNPLTPVFETIRAALTGAPLSWQPLAVSLVIAVGLCEVVMRVFDRVNERMADVI